MVLIKKREIIGSELFVSGDEVKSFPAYGSRQYCCSIHRRIYDIDTKSAREKGKFHDKKRILFIFIEMFIFTLFLLRIILLLRHWL